MYRAAVFDLDGTLGDTLPLCIESFRRAVCDLDGRTLEDGDISRHFGPSDLGVIERLFPDRPDLVRPGMERMLCHYRELHRSMAPAPFDGVAGLLGTLRERGVVLGMVTGKCMETAIMTLKEFGIWEYFPMVEPGSPRRVIKGECLLRIADHYGLEPSDIIYAGDSVTDIDACREAGVPIAAAAWAATADPDALAACRPDFLFTSFDEFADFLLRSTAPLQ